MKAIVYTSNTGYTAEYAKMLGEKLSLPVYELGAAQKELNKGAEIIYLGWLMAGKVKGYAKAAKTYRLRAVCGVGMSAGGSQTEELRRGNAIDQSVAVFTLQGGFDLSRLHGVYRPMMSLMRKSVCKKLEAKTDRTAGDEDILDLFKNGGSRVSEEKLSPVLKWYEQSGKEG